MPACETMLPTRPVQTKPDRARAEPGLPNDALRTPGAVSLAEFWARVDARG